MLAGISIRSDFKMSKNLTLFIRAAGTFIYVDKDIYQYYIYGAPVFYQPINFKSQPWNFNLTFGLKFDFYNSKKKQQTFDALDIEDPYKKIIY